MSNELHAVDSAMLMPLLPLRGLLAFPNTVLTFDVGRDKSVAALEKAMQTDKRVFVVAQRDAMVDHPHLEDMHTVGTIVLVKQMMRMPDDIVRVLVEGQKRALLVNVVEAGEVQLGEILPVDDDVASDETEVRSQMRVIRKMAVRLAREKGRISPEVVQAIEGERKPQVLPDLVAANLLANLEDKQAVLESVDVRIRLETVLELLSRETEISRMEKKIQAKVRESMDKANRDYYLREQIRVIQEELGEDDEEEIARMEATLTESKMPEEARDRVAREIKKLKRTSVHAPESSISQNYIEYMLELPWGKYTQDELRIDRARKVLESEHYGLEDVKKRILEFLAVREMKNDMKGPIICLVGPPGVGKTSIARSVAHALGRKFVTMSLGGVRDEAEIRGHRRTYIGAMPGRIVSSIKQADVMNPVFLFDEIDKMASDFRGDPASAMLEVLDPEQNNAFRDHYLEAPFDLSKVLFLTTANDAGTIPRPLLDRMELIEVPSYTLEEKVQIAKRHLLPKQMKENGLEKGSVKISDKCMRFVIDDYTREAGVRTLERTLSKIMRRIAVDKLEKGEDRDERVQVKPEDLKKYLGGKRFMRTPVDKMPEIGVVNGLAWTSVGGETMPIEVAVLPGSGTLELTGKLGDVMKESAKIAMSVVRARFGRLGIPLDFHKTHDLHIHVPEGAVPKDGPSAGVALASAMLSAICELPARQDVAMTGEITLRGKVLPIGGVKEKLLAAYRLGIETILLPKDNEKDLEEIPEDVRKKLDVHLMETVDEAFDVLMDMRGRSGCIKAVDEAC